MPSHVPAAARTISLFEVFAREKRELSNSDLAKFLDLPESSCSDLVGTLMELGYLGKSVRSRRLYPTGRLFSIASQIDKNDLSAAWLQEACELVRDSTGETTLCGQITDGAVRVLSFCEGRYPLRYTSARGEKLSLHASALGKAILSLGTPEEAAAQLKLKAMRKLASGTIVDIPTLVKQVVQFRRQGYALVENEGGEDLAALAVAGHLNQEPLAFSVAGPVGRMRLNKKDYLKALTKVGKEVFDQA